MATDLYARCPCGSGKKIKFCCKDIITDIERIERMLQGDQRTSALERINKLLEKHPDRPALLALRAQVLIELEQLGEAVATLEKLLEIEPTNAHALVMRGGLYAAGGDTGEALRHLHKSLSAADGVFTQAIYRGYITICMYLIQCNELVSAYAHLLTLVSITRGQDRASVSLLMQVTSSGRLPAIFHGLLITADAPDNCTWKREFDVAINAYRSGDWTQAAQLLEDMSNRILDEPVILRNLAILQAWTCQSEKAIKSFRYCSAIRSLDENLAIEAEACAQVLDATSEEDTDELVSITHEIDDANAMMEKLLSNDQVDSVPVQRMPGDDSPPPKGQFVVYDKAVSDLDKSDAATIEIDNADSSEDNASDSSPLDFATLPRETCSIVLFGKETDRNARLVVLGFRDEKFDDLLKLVADVSGESLKLDDENIEVATRSHRVERLFQPNFRIPKQTKLDVLQTAQRTWIVDQLQNAWPDVALSIFGGKSAREISGERKYKRKVLAAILNLELWSDRQPFDFDFDKLRTDLGLEALAKIDPNEVEIRSLTTTQIRRLELDKLKDEDLKFVFEVLSIRPNGSTLRRICEEIVKRPSMEGKVDLIEVHERLSDLATTTDEQLEHLVKARDMAVTNGDSPASWLVAELDLRIQRGEPDLAKRLITEIQNRYIREPGVAQMFAEVLSKYGLMPRMPGMPAGAVSPEAVQAPVEVGAPGAAPADGAGGIWTPGESAPAPASDQGGDSGGESKLWIPD